MGGYVDHGWRHGPGGTDPAPAAAAAAALSYAWLICTTNFNVSTGGSGSVEPYDTSGSGGTGLSPNVTDGNIYLTETGIYSVTGVINWVGQTSPAWIGIGYQAAVVIPDSGSPTNGDFSRGDPTAVTSLTVFNQEVGGIFLLRTLHATPAMNIVNLNVGQTTGVSKAVNSASLLVVRLGDA